MQDLVSEFPKIFAGRGDIPKPSQRKGAIPSRTQHLARPLAGRGAQAPQCWDPNLGPPQLFSRGGAPAGKTRKGGN